jgi:DNA-binding response OmpR family regulator
MPNQNPHGSSRIKDTRPESWRLSVLVTEDNMAMRQLMADVLAHEGYRVTQAGNCAEMQNAILRSFRGQKDGNPFDLIVSDVIMPGKNGLDALSELRMAGVLSRVLFVTSFPDVVTYERVEKLEARLLAKPFSLGEFRAVANAILRAADLDRDCSS